MIPVMMRLKKLLRNESGHTVPCFVSNHVTGHFNERSIIRLGKSWQKMEREKIESGVYKIRKKRKKERRKERMNERKKE